MTIAVGQWERLSLNFGTDGAGREVSEVEPTGLADQMRFVKKKIELKMIPGFCFWVVGRTMGLSNGWGVQTWEAVCREERNEELNFVMCQRCTGWPSRWGWSVVFGNSCLELRQLGVAGIVWGLITREGMRMGDMRRLTCTVVKWAWILNGVSVFVGE